MTLRMRCRHVVGVGVHANADQLGNIDKITGVFTPIGSPLGVARGALGNISIDDVDGLDREWLADWARSATEHDAVIPFEALYDLERQDIPMLDVRDSL